MSYNFHILYNKHVTVIVYVILTFINLFAFLTCLFIRKAAAPIQSSLGCYLLLVPVTTITLESVRLNMSAFELCQTSEHNLARCASFLSVSLSVSLVYQGNSTLEVCFFFSPLLVFLCHYWKTMKAMQSSHEFLGFWAIKQYCLLTI